MHNTVLEWVFKILLTVKLDSKHVRWIYCMHPVLNVIFNPMVLIVACDAANYTNYFKASDDIE